MSIMVPNSARVLVTIHVPGIPQPGGSKRAFVNPKTGRAQVVDASPKAKPWKAVVASFAQDVMGVDPMFLGALVVEFRFVQVRPRGHFGTGRNAGRLKPSAPAFPTTRPDATKLIRSTEDACTGIVWRDDAQIVTQLATKRYGDKPGAIIRVREAE